MLISQSFKTTFSALGLILALTAPLSAEAHRNWIKPSTAQSEGKQAFITVDAAVSENLFEFDTPRPLALDGLLITGPDGSIVKPENVFTGSLRASFDVKLATPGTYKISLVNETVMGSYKLGTEVKRFRGTAEAFTKELPADAQEVSVSRSFGRVETFSTLAKPNDAALKPTGKGLELVPITHPSDLVAGEAAQFRFLLDGQPISDLAVTIIPEGVKFRKSLKDQSVKTDAKGEFSVTWTMGGFYWIGASYPARSGPPGGGQGGGQGGGMGGGEGGPGGQAGAQGPAGAPQASGGAPQGPRPQQAQPEKRYSYAGTFEVLPD